MKKNSRTKLLIIYVFLWCLLFGGSVPKVRAEEPVTYTEQVFAEQGLCVSVFAPEGVLPEGARVLVELKQEEGLPEGAVPQANSQNADASDTLDLRSHYYNLEKESGQNYRVVCKVVCTNENGEEVLYTTYDPAVLQIRVNTTGEDALEETLQEINLYKVEPKKSAVSEEATVEEAAADEATVGEPVDDETVDEEAAEVFDAAGDDVLSEEEMDSEENIESEASKETEIQTDITGTVDFAVEVTRYHATASAEMIAAQKSIWNVINKHADLDYYMNDPKKSTMTAEQFATLQGIAKNITSGCNTQLDKIRAITAYVADRTYYDMDYYFDRTDKTNENPYDVYQNKYAVCEGYTNLMRTMLISLGIPCMRAVGENHAFNVVYNSDTKAWMFSDATWCSLNTYTKAGGFQYKGVLTTYFNLTPEAIAALTNHEIYYVDGLVCQESGGLYYRLTDPGYEDKQNVTWVSRNWYGVVTGRKSGDTFKAVSTIEGYPVRKIAFDAFNGDKVIKNLDLSATQVALIDAQAFYNCTSLQSISFPESLKMIGYASFYNCSSLTKMDLSGTELTIIDDWAVGYGSKIKVLLLPETLTSMGYASFYHCSALEEVVLPWSLKKIGGIAFESTALKKVTIESEELELPLREEAYASGLPFPKTAVIIGYSGSSAAEFAKQFGFTLTEKAKETGVAPAPPAFAVVGVVGGRNVTFSSATKGAVIHYSTKTSAITTADTKVANKETVLFTDYYGTLYAKAYKDGMWSNVSRLILRIPVVKTPTISVSGSKVTIQTATPSCYLYYTVDGSEPSPTHGIKVSGSKTTFDLNGGGTVKAIAVRSCFTNSGIASAKVAAAIDSSLGAPSFVVKGFVGGRMVTFNSTTKDADIYFSTSSSMTLDDMHVKAGSTLGISSFYGTLYARAYKNGKWSNVARLILRIPTVNTPTIISEPGGYVTIKTTTPLCALYYTTDGSTPTVSNGKKINASSSRIHVGTGKTIKAIAVRSCFTNSKVAILGN